MAKINKNFSLKKHLEIINNYFSKMCLVKVKKKNQKNIKKIAKKSIFFEKNAIFFIIF